MLQKAVQSTHCTSCVTDYSSTKNSSTKTPRYDRCNSVFVPPRVNVHRRTNSLANLCTVRENEHHGAHFRGVRTRVFVPPAKMCTMQIDWSWTWLLCRAQSRQSSRTCRGDHRCLFSFFASLRHKRQGCRVQTDDIAAFDTKAWLIMIWLQWTRIRNCTILEEARRWGFGSVDKAVDSDRCRNPVRARTSAGFLMTASIYSLWRFIFIIISFFPFVSW